VTEIPEHLLKRSRERRSAMGLPTEGADTPAEAAGGAVEKAPGAAPAPAAAAPAPRAAAPEPAPAPPPKPEPFYVTEAKNRRKIPVWAMGVLGFVPLWAFLYVWSVTPTEEEAVGPMALGAEVYGQCSSCHAGNGSGGAGRPLWNGEVNKTFPQFELQASFVHTGSQPFAGVGYGDPEREGGQHVGLSYNGAQMPAFAELTTAELIGVVCHERYGLSGAPAQEGDEWDQWCSPEAENFLEAEGGASLADLGIPETVEEAQTFQPAEG
jgi:hypothetical protein